ncbi:sialin [Zophobas morio]|uniref:sialin n=1 Tax=Zophobas morio TaxID=2755281 RepID=UPI003083C38B
MGKVPNGSTECCTARNVLWHLVFLGFAVNYMLRTNLNIAIVSMVKYRSNNNLTLTSECLDNNKSKIDNSSLARDSELNYNLTSFKNEIFINATPVETQPNTFAWNEKQQSSILGAFFWLHWLTQVPGGILGSKYGAKLVFGLANFTAILCCFFIPMSAFMGHQYLIALRIVQGILAGFAWPAMHNMTARWIPPNERSKFVTAYLGSSIGAALTYPVCGFIIHKWGWEWVFYTSGVVGTVWFAAWWFLVYDSPAKHPRISPEEKEYILESLGQSYTKQKAPVPWKSIIFSVPVWMNILAQWGGIWGFFTLMTHAPTYFKFIHGWNIQATGLLSGLGHVFRTTWSYLSGLLGDYLLRTNKMSRTNVRKLATAGCTIGQGLCMLGLAYSGCDYTWAVIWLSAAVAMNGSVSTGPLASVVDISPNYASVILGIVNSVVALVGFITPAVVGQLTFQNQTVPQWQKVFLISTAMLISTGILFVLFSKSELQPWNSPDKQSKQNESELMVMNNKDDKADEKKDTAVTIKQ